MTSTLHRLIDALRAELQQYGEVLSLLDEPPAPNPPGPRDAQFEIQAQSLIEISARRDQIQQQLAWACQRPDAPAPIELLALVPGELRPLLQALFEENESLRRQLEARLCPAPPRQGHGTVLAQWFQDRTRSASPEAARPANLIPLSA